MKKAPSVGTLYNRRLPLPSSAFEATAMQMVAGGLLLGVLGLATGEAARVDVDAVSTRSLLSLGYLIVFGSVIAFTAYIWLLQVVPPTRVATYAYVNPVVAVFLGWALADETLSPLMLLGAAAIVVAVVLATWPRRAPPTPAAPNPSPGMATATTAPDP